MPKVTDLTTETTVTPATVLPMFDVITGITKQTTVQTLIASMAFGGQFATRTNPIFTGTVTVPTGVAGTSPVNKAQLDLKANVATPTFTGPVIVATPISNTNIVNKQYVDNFATPGQIWVGANPPATPNNVQLWYDTDGPEAVDLTARMIMNEQFLIAAGAGANSQSNVWYPLLTSPSLSTSFVKIMDDSLLVIHFCTSSFTSQAGVTFSYGARIGTTENTMIATASNVTDTHDGRAATRAFSGIAAGTMTISARIYVSPGVSVQGDGNDTYSMHIREVRRS